MALIQHRLDDLSNVGRIIDPRVVFPDQLQLVVFEHALHSLLLRNVIEFLE